MSNDIPTGWVVTILDKIVDIVDYEREPVNAAQRDERIKNISQENLFPYYGATGQVGWIDDFRSEGVSVLLGEDGAPFLDPIRDKAFIVRGRYWVNNHAHILRGAMELVDNRFICYQLNIVDYQQFVSGSTRLKLTKSAMKNIPLLLAPQNEQIRIVEKLEELLSDLDAGVAELKAAQKKLTQYRQSLLKAAVEGELTAEWRAKRAESNQPVETGAQLLERILKERRKRWEEKQLAKFAEQGKKPPKNWQAKYPEPVQPDTADLPKLPEGWVWASLDMLGEIASGVAKGSKIKSDIPVREVSYLRVANVQRGYLNLSEIKTILAKEKDIKELTLEKGDVLFNEGGDRDKLGRGWVWQGEVENCIHQNHVFRMRPYLKEQIPELISHHGNTFGQLWFQTAGKQTTNLASINMTILRQFPVPLAAADEQAEIAIRLSRELEELERQKKWVELSLSQSDAQRKNILKSAFSGELVSQDPTDEPAAVLLEKIRAEREVFAKKPKVKKPRAKKKEAKSIMAKLIDVLKEANDWLPASKAFALCGVADGTKTDHLETLYEELRNLDKQKILQVRRVGDEDELKLTVAK